MNQRPPGYEPDELPDCSTPQSILRLYQKTDICQKMAGAGHKPNSVTVWDSSGHLSNQPITRLV